jgi:EAL domain-containing protein (putative c-di-GMP-specific phosphodiesterase class I)
VGIAEIESRTESWPELIRMADLACNEAKKLGANQYCCYSSIEDAVEAQEFEIEWVSKIISAVRHNRFLLYQQPIVNLCSKKVLSHAEVLLRLQDEHGGVINPGACLSAAEKYDMINMIDRWVVHNTFRWLAENRDFPLDHLNINLSGMSVTREDFLHYIYDLAESMLVPTEKVCFEITETAAVENITKAKHFIMSVKQMGCRVALDDFGSGMCSFSYLKNLPVDYVKIDGEFVREIHNDPVSRSMVEAINSVCQKMGIETVAEYVESKDVMDVLIDIGVNYAQGFGIAEPSPLSDLLEIQCNKPHHSTTVG